MSGVDVLTDEIKKSPAPLWVYEPLSPVQFYILLSLAQASGTVYQLSLSIPYDSDGVFTVTIAGIRNAVNAMLRKRWVEPRDGQRITGRGQKYYGITKIGAAQLERYLDHMSWLAAEGKHRLRIKRGHPDEGVVGW